MNDVKKRKRLYTVEYSNELTFFNNGIKNLRQLYCIFKYIKH